MLLGACNQAEDLPKVQLASSDEATAISGLLRQAFLEYESLYTAAAFAATTPTPQQIQSRWHEGPVWVALRSGQIVGTVAAVSTEQGLCIRSMAIHPEARGYGLGRLLLEQVEVFAEQQAVSRMFLSTTPFLHRAIRLYEHFGFVRTEEGPHDLHGTALFTMEKSIRAKHPKAGA